MTGAGRGSPLDGPAARVAAAAVALAGMAFLGWVHRADLFPPAPGAAPANPALAAFHACFQPQAARIVKDRESGLLTEDQATLFRSRAEAFCAAQAEKASGGRPGLPVQ